ncbi:MAG: sulfur carrier protein ThiS [Alphaproteobacteria bacterium]|nr:sulfur carrier protein ThiS [Alphaproteobacteria bacterium]
MEIQLNGEPYYLDQAMTIETLVKHLGLDLNKVAVERNQKVVVRSQHGTTPVNEGDAIEIIHFIGGG